MANSDQNQDRVKKLRKIDTGALPPDGGERFNRLIFEKSPYLLQHAENPLNWHPWGDEALGRARREGLPIFLSIGYSTCHWCHVMEKESFEDPAVAAVVNPAFVPIKVDREERPDIDQVYMTACQLMTGSGGWPLTLILTPDLKPFFAATYLPKRSRGGMPGLIEILSKVAELWGSDRARLESTGNQAAAALQGLADSSRPVEGLDDGLLRQALDHYRRGFDHRFGGFGEAPKFPAPHNLSLLLRLGRRFGRQEATEMALQTLKAIRLGGIFDQIGFGLHRYSVDARWLVPHFEKMLYDQALAALAFLEAYQVSGDELHARAAEEIFTYVLRDLRDEAGGFYAGEDADSEGIEGRFYLWEPEQVNSLLGKELGERACRFFGILPGGHLDGGSIPNRLDPGGLSPENGMAQHLRVPEDMEGARRELLAERGKRVRPHRDEKILAGWNGLMIGALARGGAVLGRPDYLQAAERAAEVILERQRTGAGRLMRRWCEGEAAVPAFLEDYSFLTFGLIELYQAGFEKGHLETALDLCDRAEFLFGDGEGGYYDVGQDAETVLTRCRSWQDGALPAGGSMMALNQLRLGAAVRDDDLKARGKRTLGTSLGRARPMPTAFSLLLAALEFSLAPETEVALVPGPDQEAWKELERTFRRVFCPEAMVRLHPPGSALPKEFSGKRAGGGEHSSGGALLICRARSCLPPVTGPETVKEILDGGFPVKP